MHFASFDWLLLCFGKGRIRVPMVRARGGGTDNLPPAAGSRRHRRSAIDAERLWWETGNSSSGSGSGSSGSGGRTRRKCSWRLLLLFVFPVTFFVVFAFATLSSMHDEPSNTGISLTARAARHWAASVNSSHRRGSGARPRRRCRSRRHRRRCRRLSQARPQRFRLSSRTVRSALDRRAPRQPST